MTPEELRRKIDKIEESLSRMDEIDPDGDEFDEDEYVRLYWEKIHLARLLDKKKNPKKS